MKQVIEWLPQSFKYLWETLPLGEVEEIRIRVNRPLEVMLKRKVLFFEALTMTLSDIEHLFQKLAHYSIYAFEEELKHGYITIAGGHRVGFVGQPMIENGQIQTFRFISSLNIRIAKEQIGIAEPFLPYLYEKRMWNTLIIGPPQVGKTTLLRDIARIFSGDDLTYSPVKVAIVDERSEICGCIDGQPSFTFGPRLDVLDGCPKSEGMMLFVRSMSPELLIVDEIGRKEDGEALVEAMNAGVALIATAHGRTLDEVAKRPSLHPVMKGKIFERYLLLERKQTIFTVTLYNEDWKEIKKVQMNEC